MRVALGIVLIVFGMLSALGAVALSMQANAQRISPEERLGHAVGSSLCGLTLAGCGIYMIFAGEKSSQDVRRNPRRRPQSDDEYDDLYDERPGRAERLRRRRRRREIRDEESEKY